MKNRLYPIVNPLGITVAQLKKHIANWPETDINGEPTEVWVETGDGLKTFYEKFC